MRHDAVREARAKELKHMQDHNVFEVVWLSEARSLAKVRSMWLQDVKGDAVKARFVAQQGRVWTARRCLCLGCSHTVGIGSQLKTRKNPGTSDCSTTNRRAHCSVSASWDCPGQPGTLVETCTVQNA